ncbi:restriction endonuclease subunit S [Acinetobacter sp. TTH0-4]|uniref:restriction endonuclease subunit S n=1 Tax=Acinetobacter sp. TTH0-4 TaxID=1646498 RepID=UPI00189EC316|nr:restriction endonuclease subunit S [Acinetobacter sp. TTH0-4]QPF37340.1 restriction endonuclease subunit S [Acinetobacter sp. TTH0-4]
MAKYQKYAEYKDSGVEWLGEIPDHWQVSKVKYLAPFQVGWTPPTKDDANFIGENLWVNISDLKGKTITSTSKQISDKAAQEASMDITPKGSLMYSFKLSVGAVSFAGCDMYTNEAIASFLDTSKLPLSFLYYVLPKFIIENASTNIYGAKILNQELIKNASLLELPFKEAQIIANFLDHETTKIDSLIEKQQQLIQLLKEKRQAVISHAVTKGLNPDVPMKDSGVEWLGEVPEHWVRYAIKNLCYVNDGNHGEEYPTEADFVENGEGVPFIRAGDFEDFRVVSKNLRYISHEKNNSMRKGRLQENDILFVNRGATIGKLCIIDNAYAGSNLNSQIAYLRADKTLVDYRYLTYFLSSLYTQTNIVSSIYGGALPQYPIQNIINLDVWSGGLEEQSMIADYLDEQVQIIVYLIGKCELAIKLLQERRTALISAAVTGKIDVRNWQNPNNNNEAKTELGA